MKSLAYNRNTSESIYIHSTGVTFRCTNEAIVDVLVLQGIDLFSHLDKAIDSLVKLNGGNADFSIRVKITKDPVSADEITHSISVIKTSKLKIEDDGWYGSYGVKIKD